MREYCVKPKRCRNTGCGSLFTPFRTTDKYCSFKCSSTDEVKRTNAVAERSKTNTAVSMRSMVQLAKIAFHSFIRYRDRNMPCICCNKPLGEDYEAGHCFSSSGHSFVMFDEDNVHAQRKECNSGPLSGNFSNYKTQLEHRIGVIRFNALNSRAYLEKKWTLSELSEIASFYKNRLNALKNTKE